jgi:hypothetical protein
MVQSVGALKQSHGVPLHRMSDAVDMAFTLVMGWPDENKAGVTKALLELQPLAKHNAEVYTQAEKACQEMQVASDALHHQKVEAEATLNKATALQASVAAEIEDERARLTEDQANFDAEYKTQHAALKARDALQNDREARLRAAEATAEKSADEARALKATSEDALARVEVREKEAQQKIARLRKDLEGMD